jgi:DNA adenine methylase
MPPHELYAEAFAGGAHVLFCKSPSHVEVINDINGELINFFTVVKEKPYQLLLELQWDLYSRKLFLKYKADLEGSAEMSDVERAKRFFYIVKGSFAGQRETFGYSRTTKPGLNFCDIEEIILKAHERLLRVSIECIDFREFIKKYDTPDTLFYLDPPYHIKSAKRMYVQCLGDSDFIEFKDLLKNLKGKFILSLNDDSFIRKTFRYFKIETIDTRYTMNSKGNKKVSELLIKNF